MQLSQREIGSVLGKDIRGRSRRHVPLLVLVAEDELAGHDRVLAGTGLAGAAYDVRLADAIAETEVFPSVR